MEFNNTNNRCVETTDGETVWLSRASTVCAVLITDDAHVLVTKRSEKMQEPGMWCLPCGYVDQDESITQALIREVWEEVGLNIDGCPAIWYDISDGPNNDERQNITYHFFVMLEGVTSDDLMHMINFDKEEVSAVHAVSQAEAGVLNTKIYAYNHGYRIKKLADLTTETVPMLKAMILDKNDPDQLSEFRKL